MERGQAVAAAVDLFSRLEYTFRARHPFAPGPEAARVTSINPAAGRPAVPSDPREVAAALRADDDGREKYPYREQRYGGRGRRLAAAMRQGRPRSVTTNRCTSARRCDGWAECSPGGACRRFCSRTSWRCGCANGPPPIPERKADDEKRLRAAAALQATRRRGASGQRARGLAPASPPRRARAFSRSMARRRRGHVGPRDSWALCRRIKTSPRSAAGLVAIISGCHTPIAERVTGLKAGADRKVPGPLTNRALPAWVEAFARIAPHTRGLRARNAELAATLAKVPSLRARPPICAGCKKNSRRPRCLKSSRGLRRARRGCHLHPPLLSPLPKKHFPHPRHAPPSAPCSPRPTPSTTAPTTSSPPR